MLKSTKRDASLNTYRHFKARNTEFPTSHAQVLSATRATSPRIREVNKDCTCAGFTHTSQQLVCRADNRLLARIKIWKISPWSLPGKAVLFHVRGNFNSTHSGSSLKT